jgi:hypothetical protein
MFYIEEEADLNLKTSIESITYRECFADTNLEAFLNNKVIYLFNF